MNDFGVDCVSLLFRFAKSLNLSNLETFIITCVLQHEKSVSKLDEGKNDFGSLTREKLKDICNCSTDELLDALDHLLAKQFLILTVSGDEIYLHADEIINILVKKHFLELKKTMNFSLIERIECFLQIELNDVDKNLIETYLKKDFDEQIIARCVANCYFADNVINHRHISTSIETAVSHTNFNEASLIDLIDL